MVLRNTILYQVAVKPLSNPPNLTVSETSAEKELMQMFVWEALGRISHCLRMLLNASRSRHGFKRVPQIRLCFSAQQHPVPNYGAGLPSHAERI